jgi:hypothetical protein
MSKPSVILDEYRDRYPEPEHDWRFRAGRMAEQMAMLGTDLLQAQKLLTKARHQRDSLAVTLVDVQRERLTAESKLDSANRIIGEQLATIAVLNRIKPSPDTPTPWVMKVHACPNAPKDGTVMQAISGLCPFCGKPLGEHQSVTVGSEKADAMVDSKPSTVNHAAKVHVCEHRMECRDCGAVPSGPRLKSELEK